jgi:hypothetical protein
VSVSVTAADGSLGSENVKGCAVADVVTQAPLDPM